MGVREGLERMAREAEERKSDSKGNLEPFERKPTCDACGA